MTVKTQEKPVAKKRKASETKGASKAKAGSSGLSALDKLVADYNKDSIRKQKARGIKDEYIRAPIVKASELAKTKLSSTGFRSIDKLLGYSYELENDVKVNQQWGIQDGRIYTIYGPEGVGKTTFTLQMAAHVQNTTGKVCIIIDAEGRFDVNYAVHCGMDPELTYVVAMESYVEESFDAVIKLMNDSMKVDGISIGLVVFDSLQAAKPKDEVAQKSKATDPALKSTVDNYAVGTAAKKNNQFLGMILPLVCKYRLKFFIIGQARTDMDMGNVMMTGGQGVKHYSEAILRVTKTSKKDWPGKGPKTERVYFGHRARFIVEKAAGIAIGTKVELPYYLGRGFDEREKTIDLAIESETIIQAGSWFSIPGFEGSSTEEPYRIQGREALDDLFQKEENYVWLMRQMGYEVKEQHGHVAKESETE